MTTLVIQNPAVPSLAHRIDFKDDFNAMCALLSVERYLTDEACMMRRELPLMHIELPTGPITRLNNGMWVACDRLPDGRIVPGTGMTYPSSYFLEDPAAPRVPMVMKIEPDLPAWVYTWASEVGL